MVVALKAPLGPRDKAILDFSEEGELDDRAMRTLSAVLARRPRVLLIAWEERDDSVHFNTIPQSLSLAKGLVGELSDALFPDPEGFD